MQKELEEGSLEIRLGYPGATDSSVNRQYLDPRNAKVVPSFTVTIASNLAFWQSSLFWSPLPEVGLEGREGRLSVSSSSSSSSTLFPVPLPAGVF